MVKLYLTLADDVLRLNVEGADVGVRVAGLDGTRTGARAAWDINAEARVPVEGVETVLAVESVGGVAAVDTASSFRVALVGVAVALAALARGEVPESWLALVADAAVRVGTAATLAAVCVAEVIQRTYRVALAVAAPARTEAERSWCALLATTAHYVGFALALAACIVGKNINMTKER